MADEKSKDSLRDEAKTDFADSETLNTPVVEGHATGTEGHAADTDDPKCEGEVQEVKETDSTKDDSPCSISDDSPAEDAGKKLSSSSESTVSELNRAAQSLDHHALSSGKLIVFQRYFRQPKLTFFTKPENRRRRYAGNQSEPPQPDDFEELQRRLAGGLDVSEPTETFGMSRKPTINQAGAVIGYPERMPTTEELLANKNDIVICDRPYDSEHSLGSAETVPIEEAYVGGFTPVEQRKGSSDGMSSTGISYWKVSSDEMSVCSDPLTGVQSASPLPEDVNAKSKKEREASKPIDIPSKPTESGASYIYPIYKHKAVSRHSPSKTDPQSAKQTKIPPIREMSKDSSADISDRNVLSTESSVDMEMYMTEKSLRSDYSPRKDNIPSSVECSHPSSISDIDTNPSGVEDLCFRLSGLTVASFQDRSGTLHPASVTESAASCVSESYEESKLENLKDDVEESSNSDNEKAA